MSTIADGRTEILKELAKTDAVTHAVSVALLDDRRILWEEAFGLVDKTRSQVEGLKMDLLAAGSRQKATEFARTIAKNNLPVPSRRGWWESPRTSTSPWRSAA